MARGGRVSGQEGDEKAEGGQGCEGARERGEEGVGWEERLKGV